MSGSKVELKIRWAKKRTDGGRVEARDSMSAKTRIALSKMIGMPVARTKGSCAALMGAVKTQLIEQNIRISVLLRYWTMIGHQIKRK
jgi:hypothetical protein